MKSAMPFAGVKVPEMRRIAKALIAAHPLDAGTLWRDGVLGLWNGAELREERYVAIELFLAKRYAPLRTFDAAPIAEHLIVTGAWWDLVDSLAPPFLGELLLNDPARTVPLLVAWSRDDDTWKRRAALIAQLRLKKRTDEKLLFALIAPSLPSTEFFLRKAIGWALREYSKTAPASVAAYVRNHASRLSPLSRREAMRLIETTAPASRSASGR
jgi:3-methyladenine DNA glycosylase AlkD